RAVHFHDQAHQVATWFIFVAVPIRMFVVGEFLLRGGTFAVVNGRRNHRVARAPSAVRAIVITQTSAEHFVGSLLRFDVDARVNGKTALGDASRVPVFEVLTDVLNGIVKGG